MYDVKSPHAEEFIDDGEIRETLAFAEEHKRDRELIDSIIDKAARVEAHGGIVCQTVLTPQRLRQPVHQLAGARDAVVRDDKVELAGGRVVMVVHKEFVPLCLAESLVQRLHPVGGVQVEAHEQVGLGHPCPGLSVGCRDNAVGPGQPAEVLWASCGEDGDDALGILRVAVHQMGAPQQAATGVAVGVEVCREHNSLRLGHPTADGC